MILLSDQAHMALYRQGASVFTTFIEMASSTARNNIKERALLAMMFKDNKLIGVPCYTLVLWPDTVPYNPLLTPHINQAGLDMIRSLASIPDVLRAIASNIELQKEIVLFHQRQPSLAEAAFNVAEEKTPPNVPAEAST